MGHNSFKDDELSRDRTHLANERTLLAFIRTGLSFFVLGVFLIKFVEDDFRLFMGGLAILFGCSLILLGDIKFKKYKDKIRSL